MPSPQSRCTCGGGAAGRVTPQHRLASAPCARRPDCSASACSAPLYLSSLSWSARGQKPPTLLPSSVYHSRRRPRRLSHRRGPRRATAPCSQQRRRARLPVPRGRLRNHEPGSPARCPAALGGARFHQDADVSCGSCPMCGTHLLGSGQAAANARMSCRLASSGRGAGRISPAGERGAGRQPRATSPEQRRPTRPLVGRRGPPRSALPERVSDSSSAEEAIPAKPGQGCRQRTPSDSNPRRTWARRPGGRRHRMETTWP